MKLGTKENMFNHERHPAVAGLVAKGEIPKAGQTTGAPRFSFMHLHALHGEVVLNFSCLANSKVSPATAGCRCG